MKLLGLDALPFHKRNPRRKLTYHTNAGAKNLLSGLLARPRRRTSTLPVAQLPPRTLFATSSTGRDDRDGPDDDLERDTAEVEVRSRKQAEIPPLTDAASNADARLRGA